MQANKDKEIQIKETDKDYYHLEHTRIIVDGTGKHPTNSRWIQIYSRKEFDRLMRFIDKQGAGAISDDERRIVHDPNLQAEIEAAAKEKAAAKAAAAEKKEKAEKAKADKLKAAKAEKATSQV